jgi:tetratricopeptide (TPR) repeat protein
MTTSSIAPEPASEVNAPLLLEQGLVLHRQGQFAEALQVYENLLARFPEHADALHLTGEALYRQGRPRLALNYVNRAIARSPHHFYFNTRATIFMHMGLLAEAQQDLRRAVKALPNYPEAYVNLSAVYRQQKKFRQAREAAADATRLAPQAPAAWNNAGAIDMEQDRFDEAVIQFQQALKLDPNYTTAHKNIGKIRAHQKDWAGALASLEQAATDPRDFEASYLLARALLSAGRTEDAIAPLQHAMRNWPAEERHKALSDPEGVAALYGVCGALEGVSMRFTESAELYKLALESLPEHELLLNNLGTVNFRLGHFDTAIEVLKKALEVHPRQVLARCNLGVTYVMAGQSKAAIAEFEQCLRDDPNFMPAMVWMLGEKAHIADWNGVPELREKIAAHLDNPGNDQTVSSFILMSNYDDARRLMTWTQRSATLADKNAGIKPFADAGARRTSPRIRVGYYSFDFRNHPVAHLTAELFARHDRKDFEVFAYSYGRRSSGTRAHCRIGRAFRRHGRPVDPADGRAHPRGRGRHPDRSLGRHARRQAAGHGLPRGTGAAHVAGLHGHQRHAELRLPGLGQLPLATGHRGLLFGKTAAPARDLPGDRLAAPDQQQEGHAGRPRPAGRRLRAVQLLAVLQDPARDVRRVGAHRAAHTECGALAGARSEWLRTQPACAMGGCGPAGGATDRVAAHADRPAPGPHRPG